MKIFNRINITKGIVLPIIYVFIGFLLTSLFFVKVLPVVNSFHFDRNILDNKLSQFGNIFRGKLYKPTVSQPVLVTSEENIITSVVKKSLPSVVTIGIDTTIQQLPSFRFNPFDPYAPLQQVPGRQQEIKQNIGSGFIVSNDGLIITNKHVVGDTEAKYKVITNDDKVYDVVNIYRDTANDLAILKINASNLAPLDLGDSSSLVLGQTVVAVGTPLGEFKNTVTAGIVSGLGRGITAGSPFSGSGETLNGVIQTDAAISPGNSGGPLLNSSAQVIGVNTAIASEGQNIGFALPVNEVKKLMDLFNKRGANFSQPFLGVHYKMLPKSLAVMNDLPQGAYIIDVQKDSPADKAKLQSGDIILQLEGQQINGDAENALAQIIASKRVGQDVTIKYWRDGKTQTVKVKLADFKQ